MEEGIRTGGNPESSWGKRIVWAFSDCDVAPNCEWAINGERLQNVFWETIFPKMRYLGLSTLNEIFIRAKKENHAIAVDTLNKCARDRLNELKIEAESLYSIRLGGTLRLYGFLVENVYHLVWFDSGHGDNDTCVCKSKKRNT